MSNYGYKIKKHGDKFYFGLYFAKYPDQPIGKSIDYPTRHKCLSALDDFRDIVISKELAEADNLNLIIKFIKTNNINRYIFEYFKDGELIFFRTKGYYQRSGCKKGIASIYRNIEEYTKNELFD